jgi:hypothetical protein
LEDCGCCAWSVASRYAPDRLEVTLDHLTDTIVLKARVRSLELLKTRREHGWQFWRRRYTGMQDAFEQALRELKVKELRMLVGGKPGRGGEEAVFQAEEKPLSGRYGCIRACRGAICPKNRANRP